MRLLGLLGPFRCHPLHVQPGAHLHAKDSGYLNTLRQVGHDELGAKDAIPEPACNPESILVVLPVMIKMIGFELAVERWKPSKISLEDDGALLNYILFVM